MWADRWRTSITSLARLTPPPLPRARSHSRSTPRSPPPPKTSPACKPPPKKAGHHRHRQRRKMAPTPQPQPTHNHFPGNDTVHVTYIVNGKTVTISVPYGRWRDGGHAPVGRAIQELHDKLALQKRGGSGSIGGEAGQPRNLAVRKEE